MWNAARPLVVGTRASRLAQTQTAWVVDRLVAAHPGLQVRLAPTDTEGDHTQAANVPLQELAGRGVFVKDLEAGIIGGRFDAAVHSLKDITTDLTPGLALVAIPEREDPRDVLISRDGSRLHALPVGATVGTSSPRRAAQLAACRRDLRFVAIRGNVDPRLRKLDAGDFDAIVLAAAGLSRLVLSHRVTDYLDPEVCMPDPGQAALAVEAAADNAALAALFAALDDPATNTAVTAERAMLHALGGGCQLPVGALGRVDGATLTLRGVVCSPDGALVLRDSVIGTAAEPAAAGRALAEHLLAKGARRLLEPVRG